jgi:ABC-type glycerol-3-phosphate transport system substrate-binding protein
LGRPRDGLEFVRYLPPDAVSYDDASNNPALISGKSALIYNPPSAWAVAKRDAPDIARDCWTFPCPAGPVERSIRQRRCGAVDRRQHDD